MACMSAPPGINRANPAHRAPWSTAGRNALALELVRALPLDRSSSGPDAPQRIVDVFAGAS